MRRVLLLAALAAPALAAAQTLPTAGQVLNGTTKGTGEPIPDDKYINIDECNGAVTSDLELLWSVTLEANKTVNGGVFRIFASNKEPATTAPRYCQDQNVTNSVYTAQVGVDVQATANDPTDNASVPANEFAISPPFTCTEGQTDQTIYLCVHYFDKDAARVGWAVGSLTLSLRRPPAPPAGSVVASGGENALDVSWTRAPDPTGNQAPATGYRVIVTEKASGTEVRRRDVESTSVRIDGLVNGTTYTVAVYGTSVSMNQSATAATADGTPEPVLDFWEYYRSRTDGTVVEEGGCSAGAAGPLALLGVAGLLAARRRRS